MSKSKPYKCYEYQTCKFLWQGLLVLTVVRSPSFPWTRSKNTFTNLPWNAVLPCQRTASSGIHGEAPGPTSRPGLSGCPTRFTMECWFLPEPVLTRMVANDGFPTLAFSPVSAQHDRRQEPSLLTFYLFIINMNSLVPLIILCANDPNLMMENYFKLDTVSFLRCCIFLTFWCNKRFQAYFLPSLPSFRIYCFSEEPWFLFFFLENGN